MLFHNNSNNDRHVLKSHVVHVLYLAGSQQPSHMVQQMVDENPGLSPQVHTLVVTYFSVSCIIWEDIGRCVVPSPMSREPRTHSSTRSTMCWVQGMRFLVIMLLFSMWHVCWDVGSCSCLHGAVSCQWRAM